MNIEIVDRLNQIEIQEQVFICKIKRNRLKQIFYTKNRLRELLYNQETERRQRELTSRVRAPAEAEKYRMQVS